MSEAAVSVQAVEELANLLEPVEEVKSARTPVEIMAILAKPFDKKTHKTKDGYTYIPHAVIRRRVNNATGGVFNFEILGEEFRDGSEIGKADVVVHKVKGRLTIPGLGYRDEVGTAALRKRGSSEESYKGAASDCFKRCVMAFGGALEMYPGELEQVDGAAGGSSPTPIEQGRSRTSMPSAKTEPKTEAKGNDDTMKLPEIKAEIKRLADVLSADWMATTMKAKFNVAASSELTEEQWRQFYAVAIVEEKHRAKAA